MQIVFAQRNFRCATVVTFTLSVAIHCEALANTVQGYIGQALNPARPGPARPTSLKTVPARPKIRPGQEDVKSRRWLIKGNRRLLLRNYVGVRRRPEHAQSILSFKTVV